MDRDPAAMDVAKGLVEKDERVTATHSAFSNLKDVVESADLSLVDGVLLDLGFPRLNWTRANEDLVLCTMDRSICGWMCPQVKPRAIGWLGSVLKSSEPPLRRMEKSAGLEKLLLGLLSQEIRILLRPPTSWLTSWHQYFKRAPEKAPSHEDVQAIRIVINEELRELEAGLAAAVSVLAPRGRLVVISFHSLEDRATKQFMRRLTAHRLFLEITRPEH